MHGFVFKTIDYVIGKGCKHCFIKIYRRYDVIVNYFMSKFAGYFVKHHFIDGFKAGKESSRYV